MGHAPLYVAAVCLSAAVALTLIPAAGLVVAAVLLVGLWWLTQEVDDANPS